MSVVYPRYLHILHRGLVLIRQACQCGDVRRAEAIADALHNLPLALERPGELAQYPEIYLAPLVQLYPDLAELLSEAEGQSDELPNGNAP